jgi:23S rRNA pseudouridine2457 synthase
LLLTDDGKLQHHVTEPKPKLPRTYWVQVEGVLDETDIFRLPQGDRLKQGLTRLAEARLMGKPLNLWPREAPIPERTSILASWMEWIIRA